MKNRTIVFIFRIILITTFIFGMIYLIYFVRMANISTTMTNVEFLRICKHWTYVFYAYMLLTIGSTVLSVITFPATSKPAAILRTLTLLFASVSNILSISFVNMFRGYEEAYDAAHAIDDMMRKGEVYVIMSFTGAMLLFFLMVSSIYAMVTFSGKAAFEQEMEKLRQKEEEKARKAEANAASSENRQS